MLTAKNKLIGKVKSKSNLKGKLNNAIIYLEPELENLEITPTKEEQIFNHENSYGYDEVKVKSIPNEYIIPKLGNKSITVNGTYNASDDNLDGYSSIEVTTSGDPELEASFISSIDDSLGANITKLPNGITKIGSNAFAGCENFALTSLPDTITEIGNSGFSSCTYLSLEKLPDNLTSVGNYAFYLCTNLALTKLPSNLAKIGDYAFRGCTNLALMELPSNLTEIGDYTFYACTNIKLTSLPNGITKIGTYAFYRNVNLTLTELPSSLTEIGTYAFYQCTGITNLTINGTVKTIPRYAFYNSGLTELIINSPVTTIASNSLQNCSNLSKIVFNNITSVPTLQTNAISGTAIANGNGYIYVPDDLVDSSKSESGWSTYADQIKPTSELEVA